MYWQIVQSNGDPILIEPFPCKMSLGTKMGGIRDCGRPPRGV